MPARSAKAYKRQSILKESEDVEKNGKAQGREDMVTRSKAGGM